MRAPLRLGVAGLGTVGAAVVRLIGQEQSSLLARTGRPIEVVAVTARSKAKKRGIDLRKIRWVADPQRLAADPEIDVFVELMGGADDPAKSAVAAALAAGKSVVTANKALLARHGVRLAELAEKKGVALNFEAAVGGAIPIVKTLREGMAGNSFARIYGILNGTCNYILTRMEREKLAFAECLKDAQRLGYAEADPTFDIEGHDTRVLLIHPILDHPQLLGTSRHISGAFSVRELDWDAAKRMLRGTAETVPGDPYTLFVHVPEGTSVVKAQANMASGSEVPMHWEQHGELLSATFDGQAEMVRWQLEFAMPVSR